ncbi:MAG TPA: hypothetical protein VJ773_09265 [Gemmatimonadales bacterium]|nr:hypothetical protein [Gemmatimonadales bacterium]
MRALEPWVEPPVARFLVESSARLVLLTTTAGQVVAQHGFTRAVDLMAAAALGAAIVASTDELGRLTATGPYRAVAHQGPGAGLHLEAFDLPHGRWIGLAAFGRETSLGVVRVFFDRMVGELRAASPWEAPPRPVLAADFERELGGSLQALFGR